MNSKKEAEVKIKKLSREIEEMKKKY